MILINFQRSFQPLKTYSETVSRKTQQTSSTKLNQIQRKEFMRELLFQLLEDYSN